MSFISTVPVNTGGGPVNNALPVAVMQAMGAAGSNPTAKLLLPQAVTAPVLVSTFNPETRQLSKIPARMTTNQPVSALTAQLLAQSADNATESLEVTTPRLPTNTQTQALPQQNPGSPQAADEQAQTPVSARELPQNQPAAQQQAKVASNANQPAQQAAILSFTMTQPTGVARKAEGETTAAKPEPSSKERVSNPAQRGASAYQSIARLISDKIQVPVEAIG